MKSDKRTLEAADLRLKKNFFKTTSLDQVCTTSSDWFIAGAEYMHNRILAELRSDAAYDMLDKWEQTYYTGMGSKTWADWLEKRLEDSE